MITSLISNNSVPLAVLLIVKQTLALFKQLLEYWHLCLCENQHCNSVSENTSGRGYGCEHEKTLLRTHKQILMYLFSSIFWGTTPPINLEK